MHLRGYGRHRHFICPPLSRASTTEIASPSMFLLLPNHQLCGTDISFLMYVTWLHLTPSPSHPCPLYLPFHSIPFLFLSGESSSDGDLDTDSETDTESEGELETDADGALATWRNCNFNISLTSVLPSASVSTDIKRYHMAWHCLTLDETYGCAVISTRKGEIHLLSMFLSIARSTCGEKRHRKE